MFSLFRRRPTQTKENDVININSKAVEPDNSNKVADSDPIPNKIDSLLMQNIPCSIIMNNGISGAFFSRNSSTHSKSHKFVFRDAVTSNDKSFNTYSYEDSNIVIRPNDLHPDKGKFVYFVQKSNAQP